MAEDAFYRAVALAGGESAYTLNGAVLAVTIMKDITAEDYFSVVQDIFSDNAGHGLHINRFIQHLLNPDVIPMDDDILLETILQVLGPHVDLWRLVLKHKWLLLCILFLSRYLCLLHPTILVVWSAPVMELLVNNQLNRVWKYLSETDLVLFMGGDSGDYLLPILNEHKAIPASQGEDNLDRQCEIMIVDYGYHSSHIALAVSLRHPGHIKYNPILEQLGLQLYHLGSAVVEVVKGVAAQMQIQEPISLSNRNTRLAWLKQCKKTAQDIVRNSGLQNAIDNTKQEFKLRVSFFIIINMIIVDIMSGTSCCYAETSQQAQVCWTC
jgi:hypothetical protein